MHNKLKQLCAVYNSNLKKNLLEDKDFLIYHYTSNKAIDNILKNAKIRFSDRNFLNDLSEGKYILKLCINYSPKLSLQKEVMKEFKELCREYLEDFSSKNIQSYICCFSTTQDSLALWNYYTKDESKKGYNLCFSSAQLKRDLQTFDENTSSHDLRYTVYGNKVIYSVKKQKAIIKEVIKSFIPLINDINQSNHKIFLKYLIECLIYIGIMFKHPGFSGEEEYRLAFVPKIVYKNNNIEYIEVLNTRPIIEKQNDIIKKYVDIKFLKNNLIGITASPTVEDTLLNTFDEKLKELSYSKSEKTKKSKIPLRY